MTELSFAKLGPMFTETCKSCRHTFALREARLDDHWRTASWDPEFAHCPKCDAVLEGVLCQSVDLDRTLTPRNVVIFVVVLSVCAVGVLLA